MGISLTSWHYMWRTTPFHRRELPGLEQEDSPPQFPSNVPADELQPAEQGVGPLFHRRYCARIRGAECSAEELIDLIRANPNRVVPHEFARFIKVKGDKGELRVADEFTVRMPGPWDGPVRVVDVTPRSFRLATLKGHLEAGQIEFRASDDDGDIELLIESWARSGDRFSKFLYQNLRMAKEVQLHMWTSFLERAAKRSGGRLVGGIDIETRRVDEVEGGGHLRDPNARGILDELRDKTLNFDVHRRGGYPPGYGWLVDNYRQSLPGERPGPPVPGGSWEVAQRLIRDYEFADPTIVRAVYEPDDPLDGRDMLLEIRFYGLRFRFGVRIGGVRDETRDVDGRQVRVWGWNYRTLQGHLEMGQMDYEVWKWLDSGDVEFVVCRFSRPAPVRNPLVRLGLRLFGRRQQEKFVARACQRMACLTAAALGDGEAAKNVPRVFDRVEVRPARGRL
ncbi:MAG: DUF1990 domain-containing protein [Actinomycetota bacterium]|nr:DUF1990 domain-containing protein [Actinomycetota bacterium]